MSEVKRGRERKEGKRERQADKEKEAKREREREISQKGKKIEMGGHGLNLKQQSRIQYRTARHKLVACNSKYKVIFVALLYKYFGMNDV